MSIVEKLQTLYFNEEGIEGKNVPYRPEDAIIICIIIEAKKLSGNEDDFIERTYRNQKVRDYLALFDIEDIFGHILNYEMMAAQRIPA